MDKKSHTHTHTHTHTYSNLDIPIFAKLYEFYKYFSHFIPVFPKTKRFTLAQKIDLLTLAIIELVITANYSSGVEKLTTLRKVSIKLDLLKILIRLSFETKCINANKYQELSSQLVEIGRMLGGWMKSISKSGH